MYKFGRVLRLNLLNDPPYIELGDEYARVTEDAMHDLHKIFIYMYDHKDVFVGTMKRFSLLVHSSQSELFGLMKCCVDHLLKEEKTIFSEEEGKCWKGLIDIIDDFLPVLQQYNRIDRDAILGLCVIHSSCLIGEEYLTL